MTQARPLQQSASSVIANGAATVTLGPQIVRERWTVSFTTVTSLNMLVTVALSDGTISDSTQADPRPTVTDNTVFDIPAGHFLRVTWSVANSGVTNGTPVVATVQGTRRFGGAI